MADNRRFVADVEKWVDGVEGKLDAVMRQTCQQLGYEVILTTPVDTGNAVGGWFGMVNGEGGVKWGVGHEMGAGAALADVIPTAAKTKWGDSWLLGNNVIYIVPLEYGHSAQAPGGMVRVAVAKGPAIVDRIVASLR